VTPTRPGHKQTKTNLNHYSIQAKTSLSISTNWYSGAPLVQAPVKWLFVTKFMLLVRQTAIIEGYQESVFSK